ncbi:hypothetical protein MHI27_06060 [Paenibacillus sp. FSL H8-0261]|uniref:hypothetical protein n=1 Tax=Paenibacillus sp. FSL H8-0261 TaxID=2921381 RepID=UPI003248FB3E
MNEEMFRALRSEIRAGLDVTSAVGNRELTGFIERTILESESLRYLTAKEKHELVKGLFDSFRGLDVLQSYNKNQRLRNV